MLLDPESGDLAPVAPAILERLGGDPRYKLELPASQLEIITEPCASAHEVRAQLATARSDLVATTAGAVELACAGTHPFAAAEGRLNRGERYDATSSEFGRYARRQLVFALQVHVAVGSAHRALDVYNALRSYLPEIAALAANAPFHEGEDTGLASVRPKIAEGLTRQGVPPPLLDWERYRAALEWGERSGAIPEPSAWWWELRPQPRFGTLELRVPDAQTTVDEAVAVAAFAHCLIAWLLARIEGGDRLAPTPGWRIAENRWWALRDGVEGELADLETGERQPTRERLQGLVRSLEPYAERLGCADELAGAGELIAINGAIRQRAAARELGLRGLVGSLEDRFSD